MKTHDRYDTAFWVKFYSPIRAAGSQILLAPPQVLSAPGRRAMLNVEPCSSLKKVDVPLGQRCVVAMNVHHLNVDGSLRGAVRVPNCCQLVSYKHADLAAEYVGFNQWTLTSPSYMVKSHEMDSVLKFIFSKPNRLFT